MKGIYCLLIEVKGKVKEKIGVLGEIRFRKGNYVYVGSAQNSVEKRVGRHLRKEKKMFWHIDYLLNNKDVKVSKIFVNEGVKEEECEMAKRLALFGEGVKGFGCSDCKCESHLIRVSNLDKLNKLNFKELKFK